MMTRALLFGLAGTLLLSSCTKSRVKRLSDAEFDHYYALRPYMSEDARKAFLKLKTEEERNGFLQEAGLWDRFYQYPEDIRGLILAGEVARGWTKDMVMMAWGAPYDKQKVVGRPAMRSERLVYRFELHDDGTILLWSEDSNTKFKAAGFFRREVVLDDDVVAEIVQKEGWE